MGATGELLMTSEPVGHYRVLEKIGSGGMGEVFRARDERLGRDVALKFVNPSYATDPDRLRRFDQEARAAAALNHPNIVAIYDCGVHNGTPYIVSELLVGTTLRTRLSSGALNVRQAIEYGIQIAEGLMAAHEKQIIHRDLKPENIFITSEGRIKILDFGIAKLLGPRGTEGHSVGTMETQTRMGSVLGTVAYMSPEQLRSQPVDARSDLFSLGAILYEMLTGHRAFRGETDVDTITAVLKEDPPELMIERTGISPAFEQIVHHCLEKDPEKRFQSAGDLAFALRTLSPAATTREVRVPRRIFPYLRFALAVAATGALAAAIWFLAMHYGRGQVPDYHRLTFRRGTVFNARFAPNGEILYEAAWNGRDVQIFASNINGQQARQLEFSDAHLLAVSSENQLALMLGGKNGAFLDYVGGVLALAPEAGGSPRQLLEDAPWVDFDPKGRLAVVHQVEGHSQLEYPIGKVLYRSNGWISHLRFSPSGDTLAFMDHPVVWDDRGDVAIADLQGKVRHITPEYDSEYGLAWHPNGEIWFTATQAGSQRYVMAVTPKGAVRRILRDATTLDLLDIAPDGALLIAAEQPRVVLEFAGKDNADPRDLSWYDGSVIKDISQDGQWILFEEDSEPLGSGYAVVARKVDGSHPMHLGDGSAGGLSPDGKWALAVGAGKTPKVTMLPIGPGQARDIPVDGLEKVHNGSARFTADGKHVTLNGNEAGHGVRGYMVDLETGKRRPITPEGVEAMITSPDGRWILAQTPAGAISLCSLETGTLQAIPGLHPEDYAAQWTADSQGVYIYRIDEHPVRLERVDILTGKRTLVRTLHPSERVGVITVNPVTTTRDASEVAFSYYQNLSSLYRVSGLK
jgi:hypothetical protein